MTKRAAGQPRRTKCSPEVQALIVAALRQGASWDDAAELAGISPRTLARWRKAVDDPDAPAELAALARAIIQARAEAVVAMCITVVEAAVGGRDYRHTYFKKDGTKVTVEKWRKPDGWLALEWLSRIDPARWGRRTAAPITPRPGDAFDTPAVDVLLADMAARLVEFSHRDNTVPGDA